jgi:NAD(P)-dependent dehydrogenase (short-subunit alcohol dehydrogenase family)
MTDPMNLYKRRILVTGATSGIGRECSVALSELGANITLVARNKEKLRELKQNMSGKSHSIEPFDLNRTDEICDWLGEIAKKDGPFGGITHCAGIQVTLPLKTERSSHFESTYRLNLIAGAMLIKAFRQRGVSIKPASVVLVSSIHALIGDSCISAYAASKGAVCSMVRSLAVELAAEEIRINAVAPGYVKTTMTDNMSTFLTSEQFTRLEKLHPLGMGTPRDVANAIAFLLADTGRWITGTTLVVDGGYTAK